MSPSLTLRCYKQCIKHTVGNRGTTPKYNRTCYPCYDLVRIQTIEIIWQTDIFIFLLVFSIVFMDRFGKANG